MRWLRPVAEREDLVMVSNSSELSWLRIAALAVASVIAATSVATAAEPSEAALVESVNLSTCSPWTMSGSARSFVSARMGPLC